MLSFLGLTRRCNPVFPNIRTRGQSNPACLTFKISYSAMAQKQAFIEANKVTLFILCGMGSMILGFALFFANWFSPLDKRVAVIEEHLRSIDNSLQKLTSNSNNAQSNSAQVARNALKDAVDQTTLPLLLDRTTKVNPDELTRTLPRAQEYITIAEEKRIPPDPTKVRATGLRLLNHRKKYKDPDLEQKSWQTVSKLASYLTLVHETTHPLPQSLIEEHKAQDTYFNKCTVIYKEGTVINLENAHFIDCDFEVDMGDAGDGFFRAIFNSSGLAVKFEYPPKIKPTQEPEGNSVIPK